MNLLLDVHILGGVEVPIILDNLGHLLILGVNGGLHVLQVQRRRVENGAVLHLVVYVLLSVLRVHGVRWVDVHWDHAPA